MDFVFRITMVWGVMVLAACSARYVGTEYYYTDASGIDWSCREPRPYKGGFCAPVAAWPKEVRNVRSSF